MSNSSESYFSNSTKPPLKAFIPGAEEKYAKKLWEILSVADIDGNKEVSKKELNAKYDSILAAHPKDSFKVVMETLFENKDRQAEEKSATSGITKADCDEVSATISTRKDVIEDSIKSYATILDIVGVPQKTGTTLIQEYIANLNEIDPNHNGATVGELMMNNDESLMIEFPSIPMLKPSAPHTK